MAGPDRSARVLAFALALTVAEALAVAVVCIAVNL